MVSRWRDLAISPTKPPPYLSRYTHRVAISNRRLIAANERCITFKVKDYRIEGPDRYKTMTLDAHEFIRRFLIHVLPKGLHRIRHILLKRLIFQTFCHFDPRINPRKGGRECMTKTSSNSMA